MTPREFDVWATQKIKRIENNNEKEQYRLACIICEIRNSYSKKKCTPDKIFKRKKKTSNKKPMSVDMMAQCLKAYTIALNGNVEG